MSRIRAEPRFRAADVRRAVQTAEKATGRKVAEVRIGSDGAIALVYATDDARPAGPVDLVAVMGAKDGAKKGRARAG